MSEAFFAHATTYDVIAELEGLRPTNPFVTMAYCSAREASGFEALIAGVRRADGALIAGCTAFSKRGRLAHHMEIPSMPLVSLASAFWPGLLAVCRQRRVTQLALGTYASDAGTTIPALGPADIRRERTEFVIDLRTELRECLCSNHRRNVKKAQQMGVTMQRTRSMDALRTHLSLMNQSMVRRRGRGESVETETHLLDRLALLDSGTGELFQAVRDDAVLSSVLVLHAPVGAYYQSAGTTPDGMSCGGSHFLIHGICLHLRETGATTFNLGGADNGSSLARFKRGFGASPVALPSAICDVGPEWKRRTSQAIALARSTPGGLRALFRRI